MPQPPAPREGSTLRSLYLPHSSYENSVDRDTLHPGYPQQSTQPYPPYYENNPIIPSAAPLPGDVSPPSRFSPTTPTVEKGFRGYHLEHGDRTYNVPLESSRGTECQYRHEKRNFRNTVLLAALAVVMLVIICNVIFLDVRMMTNSNNSVNPNNIVAMASAPSNPSSSASTSPSHSLSSTALPSPTANNNAVAMPPSTTDISSSAALCIAQFLPGSTPPQDASSYCSQCLPALKNIPQDWFVGEANNGSQGQANLQGLSNAIDFCNNPPLSASGGPAPPMTA